MVNNLVDVAGINGQNGGGNNIKPMKLSNRCKDYNNLFKSKSCPKGISLYQVPYMGRE